MHIKFLSTGAWPIRAKTFASARLAGFFSYIMILIGVLAVAFEILGTVNGEVVEWWTLASGSCTFYFTVDGGMVFM
jgi:hypothetical protein